MNIREATKSDKDIILDLVRKLAEYERKKLSDVQLTLEKIEKHGFGDNPYFYILIIESNRIPVGYALYFFCYSGSTGAPILYLEDLFIEEEYRNKGFGKALLSKLAKIAIEKDCCRMEWHAFTWNEKAIQFYKSLGAVSKSDLVQFRLADEDLQKFI